MDFQIPNLHLSAYCSFALLALSSKTCHGHGLTSKEEKCYPQTNTAGRGKEHPATSSC